MTTLEFSSNLSLSLIFGGSLVRRLTRVGQEIIALPLSDLRPVAS